MNFELQEKLSKLVPSRGSVSMYFGEVYYTTEALIRELERLVRENLELKRRIALEESNTFDSETTAHITALLKSAGINLL